jgi:type I restriction enzyme S subunit
VNYHLSHELDLGQTWSLSELKEIIVRDPNCYGFIYCKIGIPIIRIGNLTNPFIDFTDVAKISPDVHNRFNKTYLQKYDILMSVRGVSIGQIGIYLAEFEDANISPNLIIIRLRNKQLAPYVAMVMVSSIGQNQIKKILAGSSKPTITAPLIGQLKIPIPNEEQLQEITSLFAMAETARKRSRELALTAKELLTERFIDVVQPKSVSYQITKTVLSKRWDSHFHNPRFQNLRSYLDKGELKKAPLTECAKYVEDTLSSSDDKIGYIEISNINNLEGIIEDYTCDYIKKLPAGRKILLEDKDLLVPKVRPYRNAVALFRSHNNQTDTASQNAFAVYRAGDFEYPYYLLAFLRHEIGLNQIIMNQSGTTYPTVTEDDISATQILFLDEDTVERIDSLYSEHLDNKKREEISIK